MQLQFANCKSQMATVDIIDTNFARVQWRITNPQHFNGSSPWYFTICNAERNCSCICCKEVKTVMSFGNGIVHLCQPCCATIFTKLKTIPESVFIRDQIQWLQTKRNETKTTRKEFKLKAIECKQKEKEYQQQIDLLTLKQSAATAITTINTTTTPAAITPAAVSAITPAAITTITTTAAVDAALIETIQLERCCDGRNLYKFCFERTRQAYSGLVVNPMGTCLKCNQTIAIATFENQENRIALCVECIQWIFEKSKGAESVERDKKVANLKNQMKQLQVQLDAIEQMK